MKKLGVLLIAIGLIAITATTRILMASVTENNKLNFKMIDSTYKACIDACYACIASCKKCVPRRML